MTGLCAAQGKCLLWELSERQRQTQPSLAGFSVAITLEQAVARVLDAKRGANLRPAYLKSLSYYLRRFAKGREQRLLDSLTPTELEVFLKQFPSVSKEMAVQALEEARDVLFSSIK